MGKSRVTDVWLVLAESYPMARTYHVLVNGEKYDEFTSRKKLRRDDMRDIAAGYKEGLDAMGAGNDTR